MRVPLTSGAYQNRSIIAGAQRCVNLYPESAPPESQAPVPVTHYPTPGLLLQSMAPTIATARAVYRATTGDLFEVVDRDVFYVDQNWNFTALGRIAEGHNPVSMADNGLVILLVDGTGSGYAIDLKTRQFGVVADPNFYGADRVDYLDTYFLLNRSGTQQFYWSLSEVSFAMLTNSTAGSAFDPLDIVAKSGSADPVMTLVVSAGDVLVLGALASEVFVDSGAADSAFERQPGALIEHGCAARYSAAKRDTSVFWLSQDREGQGIVIRAVGSQTERISTHAIEAAFQGYATIADAIGFCYQQQGHAFYVLTFPTADRTWVYELQTGQWHEWASFDQNGVQHRHRSNCCCFAYGKNIVGDWQNGAIFALDPQTFTDNGQPIVRIRTFPHLLQDGNRVSYTRFIADMQVGTLAGTTTDKPPEVSLRWSDTRGASYGNPVRQAIGSAGDFLRSILWTRLGMARDRVFELSWSAPVPTALNGAFVEMEKRRS